MGFYDYTITRRDGSEFSTSDLKGKVVLVVNTATGCNFAPQYARVSDMYDKYADQGLEVLDFPCDQFPHPSGEKPVYRYCNEQYHTRFPQMASIDVVGPNRIPLYDFLIHEQGFHGFAPGADALVAAVTANEENFEETDTIKWNFTKFVIDRDGNVVARFEPTAPMSAVEAFVKSLL